MSNKALTLRVDATVQAALAELSKATRRPVNKLVNEAIRQYLDTTGQAVERQLEERLQRLRALRKRDPELRLAFAEFAAAEASIVDDPAEGTVIESTTSRRVAESTKEEKEANQTASSAIRAIIDG
ncbi:MAG: hypothetical protein ACT4OZ_05360 [Gemmatimonadota bacterium]